MIECNINNSSYVLICLKIVLKYLEIIVANNNAEFLFVIKSKNEFKTICFVDLYRNDGVDCLCKVKIVTSFRGLLIPPILARPKTNSQAYGRSVGQSVTLHSLHVE